MTANSQLLTTTPKSKLSKQLEQERITEREIIWRVIFWGGGGRRMREKVQGIKSINGMYKIDRGRLRIV